MQVGRFITSLEGPSLQPLVPHLIDLLLESSAAMVQKYSNGWQKWKAWSQSKLGVPVLMAIPLQVALYLMELVNCAVREAHSVSVIESASYNIRWGHRLAGMESPTGHPLVTGVVEGARRKLARPVLPNQPLLHDVIANITLSLSTASASLADIRFFVYLAGWLCRHFSYDILDIRVKDVLSLMIS